MSYNQGMIKNNGKYLIILLRAHVLTSHHFLHGE